MNGRFDVLNVACLDVSNSLLIHVISHTIIPRVGKSNNPTFLSILYTWCALHGLPLNLPYITMNHINYVVTNKKPELPYGSVLTLNVNLFLYNVEEPSIQGSYKNLVPYSMGFRLARKSWTKVEEGDSDHEDIGSNKGKKKAMASKWKVV